jgi:hypothetical protein
MTCTAAGCTRPPRTHGLCAAHRWRQRTWGDAMAERPLRPGNPPGLDPTPALAHVRDESSATIARIFAVSSTTVRCWRTGRRLISRSLADRMAITLGLHPSNLWPEEW